MLRPDEYPDALKKEAFTGTQKVGGPSPDLPLTRDSKPIGFFNLFFPVEERQRWTKQSNKYAEVKVKAGRPGGKYPKFKRIEHGDTDKLLAICIIAALKRILFLNTNFPGRRIFGDARVREMFSRKYKRFQDVRATFHVGEKLEPETEEEKKDRLFKVRLLLKRLNRQCRRW